MQATLLSMQHTLLNTVLQTMHMESRFTRGDYQNLCHTTTAFTPSCSHMFLSKWQCYAYAALLMTTWLDNEENQNVLSAGSERSHVEMFSSFLLITLRFLRRSWVVCPLKIITQHVWGEKKDPLSLPSDIDMTLNRTIRPRELFTWNMIPLKTATVLRSTTGSPESSAGAQ